MTATAAARAAGGERPTFRRWVARFAASWMLLGAGYLALYSFWTFGIDQEPDVSTALYGMVVGGVLAFVASWWSPLRTPVAVVAGAAVVTSVAVVIVALVVELSAAASDPFGVALGTYFPSHGWWLAWTSLLAVGVPSGLAWVAALPWIGAVSPARSLAALSALGAAAGIVIALVPGTTPSPSESVRVVRSSYLEYEAVLPPNYTHLHSWGYLFGPTWQLPPVIDWFELDGPPAADIQLSVWSTPLAPGTSRELFVAAQIAADRAMELHGPLERDRATMAGAEGILLRYTARPTPLRTGTAYSYFGSWTVTGVWSDCRFRLPDVDGPVHVARIVAVVGDFGYVVSVYADPRRRTEADRLHRIFAASIRTLDTETERATNVQRNYPRSEPIRTTSDHCVSA